MKVKQPKQLTLEELQAQIEKALGKLNQREIVMPQPALIEQTHPQQSHVCPNCGHCPACGRRSYPWLVEDIKWLSLPLPLPWKYNPDSYYTAMEV